MKKSILGALLIGAMMVACAPAVVVPATPPMDVSATPMAMPASGDVVIAHAATINWAAGPAALPAGARMAILDGDPTKAQLFTLRLWFPSNYRINPHYHSTWEHVTVISGVLHVGMGETYSPSGWTELTAGSFGALPANMRHFAHAAGETVIQLHGMGPWTVTYVNRADDPRNR